MNPIKININDNLERETVSVHVYDETNAFRIRKPNENFIFEQMTGTTAAPIWNEITREELQSAVDALPFRRASNWLLMLEREGRLN